MYTIDSSTFGRFVASFFGLLGGALRLDPAVFKAVEVNPGATVFAILILIVAGISQALGQSVVLLANKVTPRRFLLSLLLSGVLFLVGVSIWTAIFGLVGYFVFGGQLSFAQLGRVVSLAYAPLVLSFFVLLPYAGSAIHHLLELWTFFAMLIAFGVTLQLDFWQSLGSVLLGWLIIGALQFTIGRPIMFLRSWLIGVTAGTPISTKVTELVHSASGEREGSTTNEHEGSIT